MRYLPITHDDRRIMLEAIGVPSVEALFGDVPPDALLAEPVDLPRHASEYEVEKRLSRLAAQNRPAGAGPFFCGAGAYRHHIPAAVDYLIQRGEFMTSPKSPRVRCNTCSSSRPRSACSPAWRLPTLPCMTAPRQPLKR